jgi:hypothetical protein
MPWSTIRQIRNANHFDYAFWRRYGEAPFAPGYFMPCFQHEASIAP